MVDVRITLPTGQVDQWPGVNVELLSDQSIAGTVRVDDGNGHVLAYYAPGGWTKVTLGHRDDDTSREDHP